MKQKGKRVATDDRCHYWLSVALSFCVVFLAAFVAKQFAAHTGHAALHTCTIHTDGCFLASGCSGADHHRPFDLPDHSPVAPESESELPDERESSDNLDDELGKIWLTLRLQNESDGRHVRGTLSHLAHAFDCRATISLVILHHSWKSYLS